MSTKSKIDIEFSRVSVIFDSLVVNILLYSEFVFRGNFCSGKSRCKNPKNGLCNPYVFPFPTFDATTTRILHVFCFLCSQARNLVPRVFSLA